MYPALAVALVSAVPNWVDSYTAWQQGINLEQLPSAMEQNTFWKANLECMTAPFEWVANPSNVKVDGTICPSGDIMIRISTPTGETVFKGFLVEDILNENADAGMSIGSSAYAGIPRPADLYPAELWRQLAIDDEN